PAQHVVQRERADRASAGRGAGVLPPHGDGRPGPGPPRAGADRVSPRLHVCFFNRSYYPDRGATGQLLTELAEDLVRDFGWRVTVVAGRPLNPDAPPVRGAGWRLVSRETRHGVEILRAGGTTLSPRRFVGRAANYLTYFLSACVAGLRLGRPDVVVALTDPPIIGLAARVVARR